MDFFDSSSSSTSSKKKSRKVLRDLNRKVLRDLNRKRNPIIRLNPALLTMHHLNPALLVHKITAMLN